MSEISSSMSTDTSRISGMISGMDTEKVVKGLLTAEQEKIDSLKQDKQLLEWREEAYRNVLTDINDFMGKHYDILDPESNILSAAGTKEANLYSSLTDISRYAEISVNGDAQLGSYSIDSIDQIATASQTSSTDRVKGAVAGTEIISATVDIPLDFDNETFKISLDGVSREITLDGSFTTNVDFIDYINTQFENEFGANRITAAVDVEGKLSFSADNSILKVSTGGEGTDFLSSVGMTSGDQNLVNLNSTLENAFGESETVSFNINGVDFNFTNTTKISKVMDEINNSEAGVKISYSQVSDKFTMTTTDTGASAEINITKDINDTGDLFGALNIPTDNPIQNGQDAKFYINGESSPIYRSTNSFTIDGVSFTLKAATATPIEFTVENNSEEMIEKITSFVSDFNEIYADLQNRLSEKIERDYPPLTEAQREEMTESQIEKWEEKAQSGLLRNDSILSNIMRNLRSAFYDKIDGTTTNFKEIGITNSDNYNKFELVVDEFKLKAALDKNPEEVMALFNKEEDINYRPSLSSADRSQRYKEVGFAQRVSDILNDAVRTRRDASGFKGTLVEKIGVDGDTTEFNNFMTRQMDSIEKRIQKAIDKMEDKEIRYFDQFTRMERVISRLNAQSESLYGMMMY
ncbi:MAG: flagellar filament capping protein FliD [Bacillota bacterium]|nr:flagellar filament capping protein FliD [Bacillota bacterium]